MNGKPRRVRNFVAYHLATTNMFSGVDLYSDTDHAVALNIKVGHNMWRAHVETPALKPSKHSTRYELYHIATVIDAIKRGVAQGSLIGVTKTDLCVSVWAVQEVRHG